MGGERVGLEWRSGSKDGSVVVVVAAAMVVVVVLVVVVVYMVVIEGCGEMHWLGEARVWIKGGKEGKDGGGGRY